MLRLFQTVLALVATLSVASAGLVQRGKTRSVKLHNHAYQFRIPNTSGAGLTRELEFKQMWAENMKDRLWQLYRPEPVDGGAWPGGEGTFEIVNGLKHNECHLEGILSLEGPDIEWQIGACKTRPGACETVECMNEKEGIRLICQEQPAPFLDC
ncbi:hypothetical protein HD553DRAFT_156808 [Filobasidium floriforme]|uniref:uncharacterized protein n=1 Tax=Filobasidium floriforme TaxID=5210 RepID=UPI001E8D5D55|nr:uncharacterized protein HD553DRAFT_156808 [Filobasidium floriforme]KAH8089160.1 hypothetical protein HD553DRAFT_156808 [Filobasidium floriforme]